MNSNFKNDISKKIEASFSEIKDGKNIQSNLKTIESLLQQCFHKRFTLKMTKPNQKHVIFVMSITPDSSTIENIINAIVMQRDDLALKAVWDECNDWNIEIDDRIFDKSIIDLSPDELTALLFHEIGHHIYSNSIPQRISRVLKFEYAKTSMLLKQIIQKSAFKKILYIPILDSCAFNISDDADSLKIEIKADAFVTKMGYRDSLVKALSKFRQLQNIDKSSPDDRMKHLTNFSIETIQQFQKRQDALIKRNIQSLMNGCSSLDVKEKLNDIYKSFFAESGDVGNKRMTESERMNYLYEKADQITNDFYATEFFIFGKKKLKRIDPADIDYIDVQKDSIKTNDDKILLVSYIYSKLETVEFYLSIMNNPKYAKKYEIPHSKNQLINMRDRLYRLKDEVLAIKIPEIRYGIQVNYPAGYEG